MAINGPMPQINAPNKNQSNIVVPFSLKFRPYRVAYEANLFPKS